MKLYTSYKWNGDHDPIIDKMKTMVADEDVSHSQVSKLSGVSTSTLNNWFNRKRTKTRKPTMRPQFASVMAVTRALGYDLQLVRPARKVAASNDVKLTRNIAAKADVHEANGASRPH